MKKIVFVSILFAFVGCTGPYVLVESIDPKTIQTIAVYENKGILVNDGITILGEINATSCKHLIWDTDASIENCTDQLKMKASGLGANGIVTGGSEKIMQTFSRQKA
ncbi:MAG: hypothetical protein H0X47_01020 [Nitrospirales bacterium]|nr:hypothetical protein [Nitrospirales bacterium]